MSGYKINIKKQMAVSIMKMMLVFPAFTMWTGFVYPEITFQKNVGKAYTAEGEVRKEVSGMDLYRELFGAEPEQIRIKSRLLEFLKEIIV